MASSVTGHVWHRCHRWGHPVVVETAQRDGRAEGCPPVSSLSDKGAFLGSFLGTFCVHRTPPAARREGTPGARRSHLCRGTSHLCWDGWAGFSLPSFPPFPSFPLGILISQLGKPHHTPLASFPWGCPLLTSLSLSPQVPWQRWRKARTPQWGTRAPRRGTGPPQTVRAPLNETPAAPPAVKVSPGGVPCCPLPTRETCRALSLLGVN